MASEQPQRGQQLERAKRGAGAQASSSWLLASVGAVVGLVGGALQLLKPIIAFRGVPLVLVPFLLVEAAFGLVAVAVVLVWRRDPPRIGGVLVAVGLLAVLMDAGGGGAPPRVIPGVVILAGGVLAGFATRPAPGRPAQRRSGVSAAAGLAAETVGWLAVAAQVAVIVPFLAIGLVAPAWAVVVLYALWAALLALALHLRRSHPFATLLVPPATFGLMYGLMMAAGSVFGWQP